MPGEHLLLLQLPKRTLMQQKLACDTLVSRWYQHGCLADNFAKYGGVYRFDAKTSISDAT